MPDPYGPRGWPRTPSVPSARSRREQWLARLADMGATTDEIDAAEAAYLEDDDYRADVDGRLLYIGDTELAVLLADVREEFAVGTVAAEDVLADALDTVEAMADRSVADWRAWVGDDPTRARAVLMVEQARPEPRRTLLAALGRMVEAGD